MHRLDTESLHDLQIAVLVSADTPARLAANVATVRDRMGSTLRLDAVAGAQGELIKLWSARKAGEIDAPLRRYTVWSHGVGCALGLLGYHRASRTDGLCWGLDMLRRAPLFYDLFADDQAAHSVVLGKTGYGKSFSECRDAARRRTAGLPRGRGRCIPQWRAHRRRRRGRRDSPTGWAYTRRSTCSMWCMTSVPATGGRCRCSTRLASSRWRSASRPSCAPATRPARRWCHIPSPTKKRACSTARSAIYAGVSPRAAPEAMPRLSDLIAELERIHEPEARQLARRLRIKLFGSSGGDRLTEIG